MSERRQQASHVMGAGTCLHHYGTCMKRREEFDQLLAHRLVAHALAFLLFALILEPLLDASHNADLVHACANRSSRSDGIRR